MKKWDRIVGKTLSGLSVMALLGVFVPKAFSYSDVYGIKPTSSGNSGMATTAWEIFAATCDTIDSITFFVGAEQTGQTYTAQIYDSVTQATVWSGTKSSSGWKYQDMGFGVHAGVTRGKKYVLQLGISSGNWNYFFDSTNPYIWGIMGTATFGPQGSNDLAARVVGVNRMPTNFFGVNGWIATQDLNPYSRRDSLMVQLARAGMKVNREQIPWTYIQYNTGDSTSYVWTLTDSAMAGTARQDMTLLFNIFSVPKWASSYNDSTQPDSEAGWSPPRKLDTTYASGKNYFYNLMKELVLRYGPNGNFWQYTAVGQDLWNHGHYHPIRDWEVYNEVNSLYGWNYWWQKYYPGYASTDDGRAKLYVRACQVAWDAVKGIDSGAKIYTNAITYPNDQLFWNPQDMAGVKGIDWLGYFYDHSGQNYTDVITYHFYHPWNSTYEHRFYPSKFQADYDTLRGFLLQRGDRTRAVWANEGGWGTTPDNSASFKMSPEKQADAVVQVYNTGIGQLVNPRGPLENVSWYSAYDWHSSQYDSVWFKWAGLWKNMWDFRPDSGQYYKPSGWANKQMTGKLKNLYFNRQVPIGSPSDSVYCYEFQNPGSDANRKTWVIWKPKKDDAKRESLSVRTNSAYYDSINYSSSTVTKPVSFDPNGSGKGIVTVDTVPLYVYESTTDSLHRPDVIVDSVWTYPPSPRAGDSVWFYARLKNISKDSLKASLPDSIIFQVDGVTKARYAASRGLDTLNGPKDTLTVGPIAGSPIPQITYGDHLIKAWADSADRYVELREDNNIGYLWKHFSPKVSVLINNNNEFTNHFNNDTLSMTFNGGTSNPDSMRVKNEGSWGSWIKPVVTTYVLNFNSGSGNGPRWDSVQVRQANDSATGGDSIIVDTNAPFTDISSPVQNQVVSGTVPFKGNANDGYEHHLSYWGIRKDPTGDWCSGDTEIGKLNPVTVPGTFGNWISTQWPNGWYWHWLMVNDSAGNTSRDSVRVHVINNGGGGSGFASGFGSTPSLTMNVATDPVGNVYFAETQNSKIRKYSPRKDSLFAFSARRGDSTGLNWAVGIALKDSAILYVADGYAHAIKAFDLQGNLLLRFGSFGTNQGQFRQPCGIALDPKGRLWVSDRLNNRIQVFDSTGHFLFQFGSQGADSGRFNSPTGITITPNSLVFVSDTRNNQLQVFDSLGNYLKTIKAVDSLGLDTPLGICSDRYGDIFIADALHNRIVELNPYGERIFDFGGLGDSLCQFRTPVGLASSPGAHYLYVADMGNRRVQRFIVILEDSTGGGPQGGPSVQVLPKTYELGPAIPNPSNGTATVRYALPKDCEVSLKVYNVAGQVVREFNQGKQKAGYYEIKWDGKSNHGHKVGCGVYFYRLQAGSWAKTRKMVVIR